MEAHQNGPETSVEEGNLTLNISQARKALGDDAADPRFIETVPRRGYRFVASVYELEAESPAPVLAEHKQTQVIDEEEQEQSSRATGVSSLLLLMKTGIKTLQISSTDYSLLRLPLLS